MDFKTVRNNFISILLLFLLLSINIFSVNAYIRDENENSDLSLLISTLDGSIYSFNYESGSLNWDINPNEGDSLYTTSQFNNKAAKTTELSDNGNTATPYLIPTLDGTGLLFQYSGDSLHQIPFSLQDLVNSSPLFLKEIDGKSSMSTTDTTTTTTSNNGENTMFIGNKKTSITVIDSQTGEIIKSMSKDGSWIQQDDCPVNIPDDALMFTRSDYQVIALDPKSGLEKWNLSVGEYIPHSTKSFYNTEPLVFEGSIEVASTTQRRYKLYIKKQEKTVVGIVNSYWDCTLSSSPVSIYAYSSSKNSIKKLDFTRRTSATPSSSSSSLLPINPKATDLMIPSKFERTFMFDDYNGQFFISTIPSTIPSTPSIIPESNKNNQIIDRNTNHNKKNHNNNNTQKLKANDIYLYTSIIILITSVIVFIRSKKNFNLLNTNRNNTKKSNNNNNNNSNNKKTPKKKKKNKQNQQNKKNEEFEEDEEVENELINEFISTNSVVAQQTATTATTTSYSNSKVILENGNVRIGKLEVITNKILGTGSCGTIVYEGRMEGRKVAVKRMLSQFVKFADREVSILIQSDEHTNVVRYFAKEEDGEFIYLAISFCQKSLDMYVQQTVPQSITSNSEAITQQPMLSSSLSVSSNTNTNTNIVIIMDQKTKQMIYELFKGLEHLHSLNIIHRDIKPQNILIDPNNRVKISDMGLGKLLDNDDVSLTFTSDSHGWQPAEYLNGTNRNTKKVDIFSIGCVVYYLLTGIHPFGHRYNREKNVLKGKFDIELVQNLPDIYQLLTTMLHHEHDKRPDIGDCINHPFFWEVHKKLSFLVAASDYLEFEKPTSPLNIEIDSHIDLVTDGDGDWWLKIDQVLIDNIGRYRKYNGKSIRDLLRVIRNKFNHYRDLSADEQQCLGPLPDGFFNYFDSKFPKLFIITYLFVSKNLKNDQYFIQYF